MPTYLVRKRFGWFKRVRVTVQEVDNPHGNGPERWRATFRFIWDANDFVVGLCQGSPHYRAVHSDYSAPDVLLDRVARPSHGLDPTWPGPGAGDEDKYDAMLKNGKG